MNTMNTRHAAQHAARLVLSRRSKAEERRRRRQQHQGSSGGAANSTEELQDYFDHRWDEPQPE